MLKVRPDGTFYYYTAKTVTEHESFPRIDLRRLTQESNCRERIIN